MNSRHIRLYVAPSIAFGYDISALNLSLNDKKLLGSEGKAVLATQVKDRLQGSSQRGPVSMEDSPHAVEGL